MNTNRWRTITMLLLATTFLLLPSLVSAQPHEDELSLATDTAEEEKLLVYVEENTLLPSLGIMASEDRTTKVRAIIEGGPATFANDPPAKEAVILPDSDLILNLPEVSPGEVGEDSRIAIYTEEGQAIGPTLIIATVPVGAVARLYELLPADDNAVVVEGSYFVVISPKLLPSDGTRSDLVPTTIIETFDCSMPAGETTLGGWCLFNPLNGGAVKWEVNNPSGAGYQVKPENGNNFAAATSGTQHGIDGIYKCNSWGCWAWKVPNHCTATVHANGALSCCCNWVLVQAGFGECGWLDSRQHADWPDCPGC